MNKKVVVISSSPRADGNSETLAKYFALGAEKGGNEVSFISLRDYDLGYCRGCYACDGSGKCFQQDGMNEITEKLLAADVILFATPIYFYSMSGQLKVFIDRLVPVYTKIRADIYLFCVAWDDNVVLLQNAVESMRGCTRDCLEGCTEKGVIIVGGANEKGAINGRPELEEAYKMGLEC